MKPIIILWLFALCISIMSCNNSTAEDDSESVRQVIEAYFDGIKTRDGKKMKAVTTDDFLLFEDGRVFNNDSLISFLNSFSSLSGEFTLDSMKINADDIIANMVYHNRGDLVFNDTMRVTYNWLESATFKKVNGVWKMNFLHSTVRK